MIMSAIVGFSILGSGTALAGNTSKQVYFGSGPTPGLGVFPNGTSFGYPTNYSLTYTETYSAGVTSVFVTIQNKGGGTLNHVVLQGGNQAPDPKANPNFIPDGTPVNPDGTLGSPPICTPACIDSLPTGLTYVAAFAPTGRPCTIYSDTTGPVPVPGRGISCNVGQLANGVAVTYRFAIQVPTNSPIGSSKAYQTWFTASGNEGTSNEGSNQDAFFALGTINVGPTTDCVNANFFPSGTVQNFGPATCDLQTNLTGGAFANGAFAKVAMSTDPALCLPGFKCFGKKVQANVEFGAPVTGGLQWTVRWLKSTLNGTPKGFIHFLDAYPTNPSAYEIVDFKTTAQCPATIATTTTLPCLNGKPGFVTESGISYFKAVFTTTGNGQGRGY